MTNWCFNRLRVSGPAEDVDRFVEQAVGFCPWGIPEAGVLPNVLNFHSLVPIPSEILTAPEPAGSEWEYQHWGCKFGTHLAAVVDRWDGGALYEFETPWSPAVAFLEEVSRAWPTLVLVLDYEEEGQGFKGLARAAAGVLEDHCIDL